MQQLECFATTSRPPDIVPGRPQRAWMDAFDEKHAYRCLPLTMANSTGWEILCPMSFTAEWNGGVHQDDIVLDAQPPHPDFHDFAKSHFSHGVITFHTGYLFRTPPGWSMWCMGPPNHVKDGIQPLSGLIETDWLPFPFTMNWIFTRPGKISFQRGEPFCFITLAQDRLLEEVEVIQRPLESDEVMRHRYETWAKQRTEFNIKLFKGEPETVKAAWQRYYFRGEAPGDPDFKPAEHVNKRKLATPRHRR